MDEFDDGGWSHIHHAAFSGYQKSISRFVRTNEDQLELLTRDGKKSTPLLLACSSGNAQTVRFLVELGANQNAIDEAGLGVVDHCSLPGHVHILEHFLETGQVQVYKTLVSRLDIINGARLQLSCLKSLTELSTPDRLQAVVASGAIQAVLKILDSPGSGEEAIVNSLYFFEKLVESETVKKLVGKCNGVETIVERLSSPVKDIYFSSVRLLKVLCRNNQQAVEKIAKNEGIEKLLSILEKTSQTDDVLLAVLRTFILFSEVSEEIQCIFASTPGSFKVLVMLLKECKKRRVLACLARTVAVMVQCNTKNQDIFVNEDGVSALIPILLRSKPQDTQMAAVAAVKAIAYQGSKANRELLQHQGCVKILTKLLREGSRQEEVRQTLGDALWSIAGNEPESKYSIAKSIGIGILIEFLKASSSDLNFIGSEALVILSENIHTKQEDIVRSSATQFLVRLIAQSSTPTQTVLSIFRVFQALCLKVGFRPHLEGQQVIRMEGGIKVLVEYLTHSCKSLVQAQAAYTLSCIALGNLETNTVIVGLFEFSQLIDLMSDDQDNDVRLTVGSALALFAFNNTHSQKEMAKCNALFYSMFEDFLEVDEDTTLACAAFQVVVLARVFPDEDQASISATGIKLLVCLLGSEKEDIQAMSCNFIAGLAHTRPGIPSAFVSIGTIYNLAKLLLSSSQKVKSCAAIALGYLSFDKSGERQLLNVCRNNIALYEILYCYAKKVKLSQDFINRWKHYKNLLCLPPVRQTVCLINQDEKDETFTIASHLNENIDDSEDESISETSETLPGLPLLLQ